MYTHPETKMARTSPPSLYRPQRPHINKHRIRSCFSPAAMAKPPKKKTKTMAITKTSPSFFKIMIGDFKSSLRIPPCFAKHLKGRTKSVLRGFNGGGPWRVAIEKSDGDWFFKTGWESFAKAHSITVGDFLVFIYDGDLGFDVRVYGKNGCEKELWAPAEPGTPRPSVAMSGTATPDLEEQRKGKRMYIVGKTSRGCIRSYAKPYKAKDSVLSAALALGTRNPHFLGVCRESRCNHMTVPRALVREYGLMEKKSVTLQDPTGGSWPVKLAHQKDGRVDLTRGWAGFRRANNLVEGDVCIFEFVQGGSLLDVHITRVKDETEEEVPKSGRSIACNGRQNALRAATSFTTKDSQFVSPWKSSRRYRVWVPSVIARKYKLAKKQSLILYDPCGRSWTVELRVRGAGRVDLASGWHKFSAGNNLREGDACVFEFVRAEAIQVHIFRAGGTSNGTSDGIKDQIKEKKPTILVF